MWGVLLIIACVGSAVAASQALLRWGAIYRWTKEDVERECRRTFDDKIAHLEARIAELEHPSIKCKVELLELIAGIDVTSPAREWEWRFRVTVMITPSPGRKFTLHNECEATIQPTTLDPAFNINPHIRHFQFREFGAEGMEPRASQINITETTTIICQAVTIGEAWSEPLPTDITAHVTLIDANSNWRESITSNLIFRPDERTPRKHWIGL